MDKKFIFKSQNWVSINGILVPKWSVKLVPPPSDLERDVITYVIFSDLFPNEINTEEIIKSEYSQFFLYDVLQVLAKLNYLASFTHYSKTTKEEYLMIAPFLTQKAKDNFLKSNKPQKLVTRQLLLANMRLAFLFASHDTNSQKILGNEKEFGKLFYRVTDFLEGYKILEGTDTEKPTDEERKILYSTFGRGMAFAEHFTFANSLSRYWLIFNRIALLEKNKWQKVRTTFRKKTGVDFNYLLAVGFAIWGFYAKHNKYKRISEPHEFLFNKSLFSKTSLRTQKKLIKAFKVLTADYSFYTDKFRLQPDHDGKHFSFSPFWEYPILRNEANAYFILDTDYLEVRISEGTFWLIFDKAKNANERKTIKGKWGLLFEDYVNLLSKETYPKSPKRVFSEIDGETKGLVDLIIYYPDTLFFIEITTKTVRHDHWMIAEYDKIEESLHRIFISDHSEGKRGNSKGKAIQLVEAINKVKKGEYILDSVDLSKIKRFIPVVLFEKSPPRHRNLWQLYDQFFIKNGITDRQFLDDLEFWDVEELEMLFADVIKGRALPDILKEKEQAGYFKDSIRNFYILNRKHYERHPVTERAFKNMTKQLTKILFKRI